MRPGFVITADGQTVDNPAPPDQRSEMVHSLFGEERNNWWHRATDRGDAVAASVEWKYGVPPLGSTPMPDATMTTHVPQGLVARRTPGGKLVEEIRPDRHDGWRPLALQPIVMGDNPGIHADVTGVGPSGPVVGP